MQSIYRQVTGLKKHRTTVLTERRANEAMFPFGFLVLLRKFDWHSRFRGNFVLRFWFKYIVKQWPPPITIRKEVKPEYDLPFLLKQMQPQLVHVYYGHKAVKYRAMLEEWGWNGPWIVSFHGVDVVKFFDQPGYAAQMAKVFSGAQLVLARSQSLMERLASLGCPPNKLRLNPTPIPLDAFPVQNRSWPADGAIRMVQASRLIAKKGLFTTLEALKRVITEFPRVRFVLCGEGPARPQFENAVSAAGLSEHVELCGWLDQDALKEQYARAHLFLHPSELTDTEDQEGVPNSMLEAMATGLPIVATLHGGIPEAVRHGQDGLLIPEKDPAALAGAMLALLRDPSRCQAMGNSAAEHVRAKYGMDASLAALEGCYSEAIALAAAQAAPSKPPRRSN
jgi:glycosyltransferase involved in cell wall biosynthesis